MAGQPRVVQVGRIGRPHGLDGSVHVNTSKGRTLAKGDRAIVAGRTLEVVRRAGTDASPIIRLEGCESRDDAALLTGEIVSVELDEVAALGPDQWWVEDLIGCRVGDGNRELGHVAGVMGLPSCEALEVEMDAGGSVMVPIVSDAVRAVDVAAKRIDVDSGFLGLGADHED